jgi:hypothetical protein
LTEGNDIHARVSRRIERFLSNSKGSDRVAAEVIQMVAADFRARGIPTPTDPDAAVTGAAQAMVSAFIAQDEYVHVSGDDLTFVTLDGIFDLQKAAEAVLNSIRDE